AAGGWPRKTGGPNRWAGQDPRSDSLEPIPEHTNSFYRQRRRTLAMTTPLNLSALYGPPHKQGVYEPEMEKEYCGVGFIANIKGRPSHQMVLDAGTILVNMDHRGACGCEPNSGDGCGILTGLPHKFLTKVARRDLGIELPEPGKFAAGLVFLPQDPR